MQTNFKYYSIHDFHNSVEIDNVFSNNSFSVLHLNISSLAANHEHLMNLLNTLKHTFSVIGLSEIKYKIDQDPIINISIPGYRFVSQHSLSNARGVGFYIHENIKFNIRSALSVTNTEHESLWIEIDCKNNKNILCGIYYRHPSTNHELFLENFDMTINKVHRENKYCTIMGEFNINLLNFDTDPSTNDFLNIINTCFFCPQILQPTRITHHSATPIRQYLL